MTERDPLDALTTRGFRCVWVPDLPSGLLLLRRERIVLADPDYARETVATVALELIDTPGQH